MGLAVVLAAGGLFVLEENLRGLLELRDYRQQLIGEGEKLTTDELVPVITPEAAANAVALEEVAKKLEEIRRKAPLLQSSQNLVELTETGEARPGFRHAEPKFVAGPGAKGKPTWEDLRLQLETGRALMAEAKTRLSKPLGYQMDYRKPDGRLEPGSTAFDLLSWLRADLHWRLHAGDLEGAVEDLQSVAALARGYGSIHTLTSQMRYAATSGSLLAMTWATLQADGWTDAQLEALQNAFASLDSATPLVQAVAMERAKLSQWFEVIRGSASGRATVLRMRGLNFSDILRDNPPEPPPPPSAVKLWLQGTAWRLAWSSQDEAHALRQWQGAVEATQTLVADRNWAASPLHAPPEKRPLAGLDAQRFIFGEAINMVESARKVAERAMRTEICVELVRTAVALKRHQLRHGPLPEKLGALVPEFLPAEPHDWMDGQPLKYWPRADGSYLLYSVGIDGIDEGGNPAATKPGKRLMLGDGRDIVWPTAATEE